MAHPHMHFDVADEVLPKVSPPDPVDDTEPSALSGSDARAPSRQSVGVMTYTSSQDGSQGGGYPHNIHDSRDMPRPSYEVAARSLSPPIDHSPREPELGVAPHGPRNALNACRPLSLGPAPAKAAGTPDNAPPALEAVRSVPSQTCLNPSAREWLPDHLQQKHAAFLSLDDPDVQRRGPVVRWCAGLALMCLSSTLMSLAFPIAGSFRPAGCPGTPPLETVLANVLLACGFSTMSVLLTLYDPALCTVKWSLYMLFYCLVSFCGLKSLIEQLTGARQDYVIFYYLAACALLGTSALPWPQAGVRVSEDDRLEWPYPWRWSLKRFLAVFPTHEAYHVACSIGATGCIITLLWLDAMFFGSWSGWVFNVGRPALLFVARFIVVELFQYGIAKSASPAVHFWGIQMYSLKVSAILVRLIEGCTVWQQVAVILAIDCVVFIKRTLQLFCWILPAWHSWLTSTAPPPRIQPTVHPSKHTTPQNGGSGVLREMLMGRSLAPPGANETEYAAYHYLMRNLNLSATYLAAILGYAWLQLLGPSPARDAVVAIMFPHGRTSLVFLLLGFAVDLVQDVLAHAAVWYAMRQHPAPCSFGFVFPGMLFNRERLFMMLRVAILLYAYYIFTIHSNIWLACA